jgi:hypothetical protein
MICSEDYLKEFYSQFKFDNTDIVFKLLKDFGSHLYIENYFNELRLLRFNNTLDSIDLFKNITDYYYKKYTKDLKQYSNIDRLKNICKINKIQRAKLKKDKFIINYIYDDKNIEFNLKNKKYNFRKKKIRLTDATKDIKKRKFILFYKSGNHRYKDNWNKQDKFGVDIINYCFIYEIIKDEFINNTCQYSNTLYPYGMGYESGFSYTVNLVCSTIFLQKQYISEWHDYIHLPFYFSKGKIIDGKQYIDGGYDKDDDELYGKYGFVGHNYYERVKKVSKNRNIDTLFETFIEKIIELDNYICA